MSMKNATQQANNGDLDWTLDNSKQILAYDSTKSGVVRFILLIYLLIVKLNPRLFDQTFTLFLS